MLTPPWDFLQRHSLETKSSSITCLHALNDKGKLQRGKYEDEADETWGGAEALHRPLLPRLPLNLHDVRPHAEACHAPVQVPALRSGFHFHINRNRQMNWKLISIRRHILKESRRSLMGLLAVAKLRASFPLLWLLELSDSLSSRSSINFSLSWKS